MDYKVIASGLRFPEGPVALPDGSLLVVELAGKRVTRIGLGGAKSILAEPGGAPNGAAIGPDGMVYICNNGGVRWGKDERGVPFSLGVSEDYQHGSIQRIDPRDGSCEILFTHCNGNSLKAPNDLVFDRHGGLWFTDLGKTYPRHTDRGGVYYAVPDTGSISEVIFPMSKPNGIALSQDETILYVAETETARVWRFNLAGPGRVAPIGGSRAAPSGGALLAGLDGFQMFDSMAVDSAGNVCVATLVNGGITVISPGGQILEHVGLPDPHTTNLCFGGTDLSTAYVTLSDTGQLVSIPWARPGQRLNFASRYLA